MTYVYIRGTRESWASAEDRKRRGGKESRVHGSNKPAGKRERPNRFDGKR